METHGGWNHLFLGGNYKTAGFIQSSFVKMVLLRISARYKNMKNRAKKMVATAMKECKLRKG